MSTLPVIAVVVPCFNEQAALPITAKRLIEVLDCMASSGLISEESYILCCNDGSRDLTWKVIQTLHAENPKIKGISLAHNRGHQNALLAGLMTVRGRCDAAISIDADLQDDVNAMTEMVEKFRQGYEIVYGVRASRATDSWFKRTTARAFYSVQQKMGLDTIYDHADYRLMSNRALDILSQYGESNLFLRGIIPQIGLSTAIVTYDRHERVAGESKYPLKKMISFSIDGITSFSSRPIRMILLLGVLLLVLDVIMCIYVAVAYFGHEAIPGWTSLMLSVWFLGSVTLIGLGVVGEYIGKIFVEVKHRPRYNISEYLLD